MKLATIKSIVLGLGLLITNINFKFFREKIMISNQNQKLLKNFFLSSED